MSYLATIIIGIMSLFSIIGIIDLVCFDSKHGYGKEFKKGIEMIGPVCLSMVGIISLAPLIAFILEHTISPIYELLGLDPSMCVGTILAIDMGGFQLATSIAKTTSIANLAGVIYASMMGATIVFTIPVGLSLIKKEDNKAFSTGILYGIASIPVGTFIGGLLLNISILDIIKNLIIPIVFSILIMICLIKKPNQTIKVFEKFSILVRNISYIGLGLAILKDLILTPLKIDNIPIFNLIASTSEGISIAGTIGIVLSGALPFVLWLQKVLNKPLQKLANKYNLTNKGTIGILLSATNNMAMFSSLNEMNEKEKIINVAFAVPASFVIGDHLAFVAANIPECMLPMIISKLVSGIIAITIVLFLQKDK